MFGSGILDTAIGLIFVFLLVSMLVTIGNELISAVLLSRAKWLRIGIDRLLGSKWAQDLYAHPLIEGSAWIEGNVVPGKWSPRGAGPSYIASRPFANVLVDLIRRGDATLAKARLQLQTVLDAASLAGESLDVLKKNLSDTASNILPPVGAVTTLAADLKRLLDEHSAKDVSIKDWLDDLEVKAAKVSDPGLQSLKDTLQTLVKEGRQGSLDAKVVGERLQTAIDSIPYVAIAEAIKKDLSVMLERLHAGYTVGDVKADIQRFIDSMPARYMREVIDRIPDERMKKTLLVLFDDAENDIEKFKQNIEIWFNNAMDRVGGWYKRKSQWVICMLGLLVAVCMNVDAVLIVKHLQTHPGVRDALVAEAKAYAETTPAPVANSVSTEKKTEALPKKDGDSSTVESGESYTGVLQFSKPANNDGEVILTSNTDEAVLRATKVKVAKDAKDVKFTVDTKLSAISSDVVITAKGEGVAEGTATLHVTPRLDARFAAVQASLMELNLPLAWVRTAPTKSDKANRLVLPDLCDWGPLWDTVTFHLLGWLITALAATLGAPFWFDTLNRLISIRSAGKAPEEKPKPPKDVPAPLEPGQSPREADIVNAIRRP